MRVLPTRPTATAAVALGFAGLFAAAAWAHHYKLESATTPAPFLRDGRADVEIEPSGIVPLGDGRRMLVASEKSATLRVVEIDTGAIVGEPLDSPKFHPKDGAGPGWRGMAVDSRGNHYLVGSRGDEGRADRLSLVRFRLRGGETPAVDDASVVSWDITGPLDSALKAQRLDAGRKVAGLAVREAGAVRDLVIGLSQPDDKMRAFAADLPDAPGASIEFRPLFAFDAGRREGLASKLTSLSYVEVMGGFVVLTSTADAKGSPRGNTIWYVANGQRRMATSHGTLEPTMESSALALLDSKAAGSRTTIRLLVAYDNDPKASGTPGRFHTATLTHDRD